MKASKERMSITRKERILFVLSLILIFSLGCSLFTPGQNSANPAPGNEQGGAANTGEQSQPNAAPTAVAGSEQGSMDPNAIEEGEAVLATGEYQAPVVALPDLGSIGFSADGAAAKTIDFAPNGEEMTLSVTDGAGLTWMLKVPPLALSQAVTLKMTPLSDLQSTDVPGKLLGGILLEPDGLKFQDPAILTVTGPQVGDRLLLLTGGQDGSQMTFGIPGQEKSSMLVFHFSTIIADSAGEPSIDPVKSAVEKNAQAVSKEVRKWLKENKDITVPEPPSIPVQCVSHANGDNPLAEGEMAGQMDAFMQKFYAPEMEMIGRLLAARKSQELLGIQTDPDFLLEGALMKRLVKKVRLLFVQYKDDKEKLKPVTNVALNVARQVQLLGLEQVLDVSFEQEITTWAERALDELLNEIIEEHDYRNVDAVMEMARWMALLGKDINTEQLLEKIAGAMTFEFQGTFNIEVYGNQFYTLKAAFPVKLDPQNSYLTKLSGSGRVELTSYQDTDAPEVQIVDMIGTQVNLVVTRFDACEGLAEVLVDRFNPETEVYKVDKDETQDIPAIKAFWNGLFKEYKYSNLDIMTGNWKDGYAFPTDLHNKNANAVEDTITGNAPTSGGKVTGDFEIKLIHKPTR